jgi:hypothetical protein
MRRRYVVLDTPYVDLASFVFGIVFSPGSLANEANGALENRMPRFVGLDPRGAKRNQNPSRRRRSSDASSSRPIGQPCIEQNAIPAPAQTFGLSRDRKLPSRSVRIPHAAHVPPLAERTRRSRSYLSPAECRRADDGTPERRHGLPWSCGGQPGKPFAVQTLDRRANALRRRRAKMAPILPGAD